MRYTVFGKKAYEAIKLLMQYIFICHPWLIFFLLIFASKNVLLFYEDGLWIENCGTKVLNLLMQLELDKILAIS